MANKRRPSVRIGRHGGAVGNGLRRRGFTLAEVLVAFTLIAILSAVIVPTVRGRLQDAYESSIVAEFDNLSSAIAAYRQDVGSYPPALDYLTALRTPVATASLDRCGTPLTTTAVANYRGPYVTREILNSVGYVFAQKDTMTDVISTAASPVGLGLQLKGPDTTTAHNVDVRLDGFANNSSGGLQWAITGTDVVITFIIPTKAGAC